MDLTSAFLQVIVGKDQMEFEGHSFSHFGGQALVCDNNSTSQVQGAAQYVPDFTVRPTSDCQVLIVTRSQYLAACKATEFEHEKQLKEESKNEGKSDVFSQEWERAESHTLQSLASVGSGLSQMRKLRPKKSNSKQQGVRKQVNIEHRPLLHDSSQSSCSTPASTDDEGELSTQTKPLTRRNRHHERNSIEMGVLKPNHLARGTSTASNDTDNENVTLGMEEFSNLTNQHMDLEQHSPSIIEQGPDFSVTLRARTSQESSEV